MGSNGTKWDGGGERYQFEYPVHGANRIGLTVMTVIRPFAPVSMFWKGFPFLGSQNTVARSCESSGATLLVEGAEDSTASYCSGANHARQCQYLPCKERKGFSIYADK